MHNNVGYSVYLSSFDKQKSFLSRIPSKDTPIFMSLHIVEEFGDEFITKAAECCLWLFERGFRVIADVSKETTEMFGTDDIVSIAKKLHLWGLRIDYGYSDEEICIIAKHMPIAINASTTTKEGAKLIRSYSENVIAIHNFYPRLETGLDDQFYIEQTAMLHELGYEVWAFVAGDKDLRGPMFEGLPTLERHRFTPPSVAFADLMINLNADAVLVGDPDISDIEIERIENICENDVIDIPAELAESHQWIYNEIFTCRVDSPKNLIRLQESREAKYSKETSGIHRDYTPLNCNTRLRGTITEDNELYKRYNGEIQITRADFKRDNRVNVIGRVAEKYIDVLENIHGATRFRIVKA